MPLYATKNDRNDRFSLSFVFPAGAFHDPNIREAFNFTTFIGTETMPLADFDRKLYEQALTLSFSCGELTSAVTISGLQRNFLAALALLEQRLRNAENTPGAWKNLLKVTQKKREIEAKDPGLLLQAATSYALYGKDSPARNKIPMTELEKINPDSLVRTYLRELPDYPHDIVYFGPAPAPEIAAALKKTSLAPETTKPFPEPKRFQIVPPGKNQVWLFDYPDAAQIKIRLYRPDEIAANPNQPFASIFSRCAGRLFFGELREKRGLGYLAGAGYLHPSIHPDNYSFFSAALDTQPDKLATGMESLLELSNGITAGETFPSMKDGYLSSLRSFRAQPEQMYFLWKNDKLFRRPPGQAARNEKIASAMTPEMFDSLVRARIQGKNNLWILFGDLKKIDRKALEKFGEIHVVTSGDILVR